ncbi:MAG: PQQ-binding-like beta-propeller repeat protein [Spirochaetales bacterium]|nr:PQQ-binding-like beta-propeller repeat protein [Spirochaetales bacterium]
MIYRRITVCSLVIMFVAAFCFSEAAGSASVSGAVWPVFRGNRELSGSTNTDVPEKPVLLWTYKTGDAIRSSPVGNEKVLYIGSDDGVLYALARANGKKIWSFSTRDAIEAPPLLFDNMVLAGTLGGVFYACNAETGKVIWSFDAGSRITGSANYTIGKPGKSNHVLFGCYDANLYCLDAGTGQKVWNFETGGYINGAPSVSENRIIFGGCDAFLRIIDTVTGKQEKEIKIGSYIPGSVAIDEKHAFVAHYGGALVCVDYRSSSFVWEYLNKDEEAFFTSPAYGNNCVIIGSQDGVIHCVDKAKGTLLWTFDTGTEVKSSAVIAGEKAVVCSMDGFIYLLKRSSGQKLWTYETGNAISGSPAVINGMLIVGCEDGLVYAFGEGV